YTSGTTGRPKGAMLTHGNFLANAQGAAQSLALGGDDIIIVVLPLFHAFAHTACMLLAVLQGATMVLVPRFTPEGTLQALAEQQGTVFMGVPSMYALLGQVPDPTAYDLTSWRFGISGGAALPVEVMQRFEARYSIPIYEGDGPTECGPVTCVNPIGGRRKPGTVGLPIANVAMRIVDETGRTLPPHTVGEIVVQGPNVMKGYWRNPQATQEAFFGEWFRTGDLGEVDEDGYFTIVDRKKDLLIVNGLNVYPREVEEQIYRHPAVAEAAVVGQSDALHGEVPRAFIVLRPGHSLTEAELLVFLRPHLARYKLPRHITFLSALPKTATGKILKRALPG
ncbi:MAG: AMP-binding protein, partial [Deinococcus sp.]|nr:AMP-binding protein [Deinococcus sp.]